MALPLPITAPTPAELRSLLMRANRLLGANLVEANLITIDQLENANEKLLELIATGTPRQCTLLGVLVYELKVLKEEDVLQHCTDEYGVGLIELRSYDANEELKRGLNQAACWATWTFPFDADEGFTYIATAYYMSPAVRTFWEKCFGGQIVWYAAPLDDIAEQLERLANPNNKN